ncbi:MAG: NAD-dependent nucleoside-diphosphate sugar epimerase [Myxococcales bacterium]
MRTLVTGATGLIGRALIGRLDGTVVVLSRHPEQASRRLGGVEAHPWTPEAGLPPAAALHGVDVIFNLAGEPVADGRWTVERKRRIRDSRVLGTRNLVAGLAAQQSRPRVLVSASAVGYYGDRGDEELDEASRPGTGFLADVCVEWEREAIAAEQLGVRVACVRTGVVLATGGALGKMLPAFRMGVGGRLGSGRQWMPWVHIDDEVGILLHASQDDRIRGAINAVGPLPVTNAELTRALGHALRRPALLPVPNVALRLALGELSEILTASQRVLPSAAERTGYTFEHPDLASALTAALGDAPR